VSVLRETSATAGTWRTTRAAYDAHGEQAQLAGPRSVGGEEARSETDHNAFGEVTTTRRRLVGKWLTSTTAYDTAGNTVSATQPSGNGASLESTYRYDALSRLAAQTKDPSNPGHTVEYTYENEGAQLTRVDKVSGATERSTTTVYNPDGTLQSAVAANRGGTTLSTCNWAEGQSPTSGYDADHNLTSSRTLTGTAGCGAGATTTRRLTMAYDHRGAMDTMTQAVRSPETGADVTRTQSFAHRNDGALTTATHDGRTTTYANSPAGWVESLTDWRAKTSTHTYAPAGNVLADNLGAGAATSTRTYAPDAMPESLTWRGRSGATVRSHTAISYDIGGLRTSENVSVTQPPEAAGADTGGVATYDYDLAGRLTRYKSPYKNAPSDAADPDTNYSLDDGGNVTRQTTTVGTQTRSEETSTYTDGRLASRHSTTNGAAPTTQDTTYTYSPLGEEADRSSTGAAPTSRASTYDPAGHTAAVDDRSAPTAPDVDYAYDGSDNLISRKESAGGTGAKTRLYFYWGLGQTLAEETDGAGAAVSATGEAL